MTDTITDDANEAVESVPRIYVLPATQGFFVVEDSAAELPDQAIVITDEQRIELLAAQAAGKLLDWSGAGPVAVDRPAVSLVPQSVTKRQGCLALLAIGKLDDIEAAVAAAPRAVQVTWQTMQTFERQNGLIEAMGPGVGLTPADIDQLFITAAGL